MNKEKLDITVIFNEELHDYQVKCEQYQEQKFFTLRELLSEREATLRRLEIAADRGSLPKIKDIVKILEMGDKMLSELLYKMADKLS